MQPSLRRASAVVGTAILLSASSVWSPQMGTAQAAASGTVTQSFSTSSTFSTKDIKRCIKVTLSGKTQADWKTWTVSDPYTGIKGTIYRLSNLRLLDPKMKATVYNKCGSGKKKAKLTKLTLSQAYYADKCAANTSVGLSVGTGLSISLGVTNSCGKVNLAKRSTTNPTKASSYTQSNTGTVVSWPEAVIGGQDGRLCAKPVVSLRAYVKNNDDGGNLSISGGCVKYPS